MRPCDIKNKETIEAQLNSNKKWVADRDGELIVESKKNMTRIEVLVVDPNEPGRAFGAFQGILARLKEKFNIVPTQGNLTNGNWADIEYTEEVLDSIQNVKKDDITEEFKDIQQEGNWTEIDGEIVPIYRSKEEEGIESYKEMLYKGYWEYNQNLTSLNNLPKEDINIFEKKVELLKRAFPDADVVLNNTIQEKGTIGIKDGKTVITINPDRMTNDTIIHEFAHILIDTYDQQVINTLIDKLLDTPLWLEIAALYPELTDKKDLGKEVIATAMGIEGAQLFDKINSKSLLDQLLRIIDKIIMRASRLLKINPITVKRLAKELLYSDIAVPLAPFNPNKEYASKFVDNISEAEAVIADIRARTILHEDTHTYEYFKQDGTPYDLNPIKSGTKFTEELFPETSFQEKDIDNLIVRKYLSDDEYRKNFLDLNGNVVDDATFQDRLNTVKDEIPGYDEVKAKLKDDWGAQTIMGTTAHKYLESVINNEPAPQDVLDKLSVKTIKDLNRVIYDIKAKMKPGAKLISELSMVHATASKAIGGTIDVLILQPDGTVDIIDFKTTRDYGSDRATLLNYNRYKGIKHTAQLSLYKTMLEIKGLKVNSLSTILLTRDLDENGDVTDISYKGLTFNPFTFRINYFKNKKDYSYRSISNTINDQLSVKDDKTASQLKNLTDKLIFNIRRRIKYANPNLKVQLSKIELGLNTLSTKEAIIDYIEFISQRQTEITTELGKMANSNDIRDKKELAPMIDELKYYYTLMGDVTDLLELSSENKDFSNLISVTRTSLNQTLKSVNTEVLNSVAKLYMDHSSVGELPFIQRYTEEFNKLEGNSEKLNNIFVLALKAIARAGMIPISVAFSPIQMLLKTNIHLISYIPLEVNSYKLAGKEVTKDEYLANLQLYISNKFKENESEINAYRFEKAKDYVVNTPSIKNSLSKAFAAIQDDRSIQDYGIRSIINLSDESLLKIKDSFSDKKLKLRALLNDRIKLTNRSTYEDFIDGEYFVTKYSPEFMKKFNSIKGKERYEWLAENVVYNEDGTISPIDFWLDPKYNKIKNDPLYQFFMEVNEENDKLLEKHNSLYKKSVVLNFETVEFREPFIKLPSIPKSANDALIEFDGSWSLGRVINAYTEELTARHSGIFVDRRGQQIIDKEAYESLDPEAKAAYNRDLGHTANEDQTIGYVPTKHFRGDFKTDKIEHKDLISVNLAEVMMAEYMDSLQYNNSVDLGAIAEIVNKTFFIDKIDDLQFQAIEGTGINDLTSIKKQNSAIYRQFTNVVAQRIFKVPPGNDLNPKIYTALMTGKNYVTTLALAGNWASDFTNYGRGLDQLILESVGSNILSAENLKKGGEILAKDSVHQWGEVFNDFSASKASLINEFFNISNRETEFNQTNTLRKAEGEVLGVKKIGGLVGRQVDEQISNYLLFGLIDNHKAVNDKGEFIDKQGNPTIKPISVIEFLDTYIDVKTPDGVKSVLLSTYKGDKKNVVKYPYMKFNDKLSGSQRVSKDELVQYIEATFYNTKRRVVGSVESQGRGQFFRGAVGILTGTFRSWFAPSVESRFKGITSMFSNKMIGSAERTKIKELKKQLKKTNDLDAIDKIKKSITSLELRAKEKEKAYLENKDNDAFFDEYTMDFNQGYFTVLADYLLFHKNFLRVAGGIWRVFGISDARTSGNWSKTQQQAMLRGVQDLLMTYAYIALAMLAHSLIMDDEDEDKESAFYMPKLLYMITLKRMILEHQALTPFSPITVINPLMVKDLFQILNSPIPGMRTVNSIGELADTIEFNGVNPLDWKLKEYVKGDKAGDSHLEHRIGKLIPIYNQYIKDWEAYYRYIDK